MMNKNISLYDNTLRDGEQAIGVAYNARDKIAITKQIIKTGIKNIEAGFIAVSDEERESIRSIINCDLDANISCLSRLNKKDIDMAINIGVKHITIFTCSSDILISKKLKKSIDELKREIATLISYAKKHDMYVRFSCEDATRTPLKRLCEFYSIAHNNGADIVSIPDTCGVGTPENITNTITYLKERTKIPLSIHCHNDLGLATANSLAAAIAGADQVQVTVNGIGERAGNTALDEFVMIMKTRYECDLGIDLIEMMKLSKLVAQKSGIPIPITKPIIGENAFRHESGLHFQSIMKLGSGVYEPFSPELIGRKHEAAFGKHSGKSNIEYASRTLNIPLTECEKIDALNEVKDLCYKKKVTIKDVENIIFKVKRER